MLFTSWNTVLITKRWGPIQIHKTGLMSLGRFQFTASCWLKSTTTIRWPFNSVQLSANQVCWHQYSPFKYFKCFWRQEKNIYFQSAVSFFQISSLFFFLLPFPPSPRLPVPPTPQPAIVARSPRRLLRSAGPGVRSGGPAVVQLHSAGAPPPGEPPHQSSPHQGHLHRQAAPGRGRTCSRRRLAVGELVSARNSHRRTASLFASPPVIHILLPPLYSSSGMIEVVVKSSPS